MSEYTIFGYGSQLNRNDTDPSKRKKREDCETMPGSTSRVNSLHEGVKVNNWLPSTAIAVLPAPLQYRAMHQQQILELEETGDYYQNITSSAEVNALLD